MSIRTRSLCTAAVAALVAALSLLAVRPAAAADPVRIMPLGDSITGSPGCWRALLWNRLQTSGYTNIDFVGTLPPQGCAVSHDGDNEGHGGALVTNVADQNQLPGWLAATRPDIVLMHFGTNDVWSNRTTTTILAAYDKLVDQMRVSNPNMKVLVAQIIPLNPPTCSECAQRAVNLNNAIPGWASSKSTAQSPVIVVDQWTGFNTATDTYDGVHPNDAGDQKVSDRWYPALATALGGTTPPTSPTASPTSPSPTPTRSTSPTPSPTAVSPTPTQTTSPPPGGTDCLATLTIINSWPGGYQAEVRVTNSGTAAIDGWTVHVELPSGSAIQQVWSANAAQSGARVSFTSVSWNGRLTPGQTVTFGFIASGSASPPPQIIC